MFAKVFFLIITLNHPLIGGEGDVWVDVLASERECNVAGGLTVATVSIKYPVTYHCLPLYIQPPENK